MLNNLIYKAYISVTNLFTQFKKDEQGVTAIEYGLIAVAVAVLIVAVFYSDTGFIKELQLKFNLLAATVTQTKGLTP